MVTTPPMPAVPQSNLRSGVASSSISESRSGVESASAGHSDLSPLLLSLHDGNPKQNSPNAYVTLIAGIDTRFKYRGFLYNAIIMLRALRQKGSTADFVAMLGFGETTQEAIDKFRPDIDLLKKHGIIVHVLPRLIHDSHALNFAEMALLKITPYSMTQYSRVQFFDGDVMPTKNMDCFFKLKANTFTLGAVSPLNSGWFLALPSQEAFDYMREKAVWRLSRDWDKVNGWKEPMPKGMTYRGGRPVKEWEFNGADMDQGLFTHYFVINFGNAVLIDTVTSKAKQYEKGVLYQSPRELSIQQATSTCSQGTNPVQYYAHFTGRSKPWVVDLKEKPVRKGSNLDAWLHHLDALALPVNSKNLGELNLGSPLGYFNARFPKGGYTSKNGVTKKM